MHQLTNIAYLLVVLSVLSGVIACGKDPDIVMAATPAYQSEQNPFFMSIGVIDVKGGIIGVAARRPGVVEAVYVEEGDEISQGQLMAMLDDAGTELAIRHAKARIEMSQANIELAKEELAIAERRLANRTSVFEKGFVSKDDYDQLRDSVAIKQANLNVLRAQLKTDQELLLQRQYENDLNQIQAPADGRVVRRYANPGEGASTLNVSVMFEVEPDAHHIIRAEVSEQFIHQVSVGQQVEFWPDLFPQQVAIGEVKRVASVFASRKLKFEGAPNSTDARVVEVIIDIGNNKLLIGQRVMVKFLKPN